MCVCLYCVRSVSNVSVIVFLLSGCLCLAVEGCHVDKGALPKVLLVVVAVFQTNPELGVKQKGTAPDSTLSPDPFLIG